MRLWNIWPRRGRHDWVTDPHLSADERLRIFDGLEHAAVGPPQLSGRFYTFTPTTASASTKLFTLTPHTHVPADIRRDLGRSTECLLCGLAFSYADTATPVYDAMLAEGWQR